MRRPYLTALGLTLAIAFVLFAIAIPLFASQAGRAGNPLGSIATIPAWGQLIWLIAGTVYAIAKRLPRFFFGIITGLALELVVLFVLVFFVFPPRF